MQKLNKIYFKIFLVLSLFFFRIGLCHDEDEGPWFSGPILITPSEVIAKPDINLQSNLFLIVDTGFYDHHWNSHAFSPFYQLTPQFQWRVGISKWADLNFQIQWFHNFKKEKSGTEFGDIPFGFDFQLVQKDDKKGIPGLKLTLQEIFPTGRYDRLNPEKLGTDVGGAGSFATLAGLTLYRIITLPKEHYLALTWNFSGTFPSPVPVKGLSIFGGNEETRGTVCPGNSLQIFLDGEYSFTKNWVFAFEFITNLTQKDRFSGTSTDRVGLPSSTQFSLAPEIEYNFSNKFTILGGYWFTIAGRNAPRFHSALFTLDYTF